LVQQACSAHLQPSSQQAQPGSQQAQQAASALASHEQPSAQQAQPGAQHAQQAASAPASHAQPSAQHSQPGAQQAQQSAVQAHPSAQQSQPGAQQGQQPARSAATVLLAVAPMASRPMRATAAVRSIIFMGNFPSSFVIGREVFGGCAPACGVDPCMELVKHLVLAPGLCATVDQVLF
jgi:hypothetical protein